MLLYRKPNFSPGKGGRTESKGRRFIGGGGVASSTPATDATRRYSQWPNYPQEPSFFPIAIWLQNPIANTVAGYDNVAEAAAACGINIFLAIDDGGAGWPTGQGTDSGQVAALRAAGLKLVAAGSTDGLETSNNTADNSVSSILALASDITIGWHLADEPGCGAAMNAIPGKVSAVTGYDSTRPTFCNHNPGHFWRPGFDACQAGLVAAINAQGVGSFDLYPFTFPYFGYAGSDFINTPQDGLFAYGNAVATLRYRMGANQPIWAFLEGGADNQGQAGEANTFVGGITNSSTELKSLSGFPVFTAEHVGMSVAATGIQADTTIASVTNGTTAVMSKTATATNASATVTLTGGDLTACKESTNLCYARGNRYRATPAEVAAGYFAALANGANGLQLFSHDISTASFAYIIGATAGGAGAQVAAANITYLNGIVRTYAAIWNAETVGICSMESQDPATGVGLSTPASPASNGILTLATSDIEVPGWALAKSYNNRIFVLVQTSRRGDADLTITLAGHAGRTARCVFDMNERYSGESDLGESAVLDQNGSATFNFGSTGNYQAKLYEIA
jgi:hypothetical protein